MHAAKESDTRSLSEAAGVKEAAQAFEGLLLNELFKTMRRSIPDSGMLEGSFGRDTFTAMLDEELANQSAKMGSLGLADAISRQLSGGVDSALQAQEVHSLEHAHDHGRQKFGRASKAAALALSQGEWVQPVSEVPDRVSAAQKFGAARLGNRPEACGGGHCGLDLAKVEGTPVVSVRQGTVLKIQKDPHTAGGLGVTLQHGPFISRYLHLSSISDDLKIGQTIEAGQKIGAVGNTGTASKGSHLHFELSFQGPSGMERIDPESHMKNWKKTNVEL